METKTIAIETDQIKAQIKERRSGNKAVLGGELRQRVKQWIKEQRKARVSRAAIGRSIGLDSKTIKKLENEGDARAPERKFIELPVKEEKREKPSELVVTTSAGIRVEGLDVEKLCTLLKALSK